jgi:hypothetical protein
MKILKRSERDFLVCSDCIYFDFIELIDERYPTIKRGRCSLYNKIVDNRWETDCAENTGKPSCTNCRHCVTDDDFDECCAITGHYIYDEKEPCENFEYII